MSQSSRAFEATGVLEEGQRIKLDRVIPESPGRRVRVIVLVDQEAEIDEAAWLRAAVGSHAFADLADEPEVYGPNDGKPYDDQG